MHFAHNVRHLRKLRKLNQKELGDIIRVNGTQIGAYERDNSKPSFEGLILLAKVFDKSIDDLIFKDLSNQQYPTQPFPTSTAQEPKTDYLRDQVIRLLEQRIRELENYILDNCAKDAERLGISKDR